MLNRKEKAKHIYKLTDVLKNEIENMIIKHKNFR